MQKIKFNIKQLILPIIAVLVFVSSPIYKNISEKYINDTLSHAAVTYATLRALNAGVSIIKNSSVSLGVGVEGNLALGEAVDPINDAVERFSDMITISLWLLGSEKAIFELTQSNFIYYVLFLTAIMAVFLNIDVFKKLLILLILLRLFIPFSALTSYYVNQKIFLPQINKDLKVLNYAKDKKISFPTAKKNTGFFGRIKNTISNVSGSMSDFKNIMKFYINNSSAIIKALMDLSTLYFGKFLLNLILLPLLFVYIVKNIKIE